MHARRRAVLKKLGDASGTSAALLVATVRAVTVKITLLIEISEAPLVGSGQRGDEELGFGDNDVGQDDHVTAAPHSPCMRE